MTTEIFLIILFAAFLHAFWNALVKSGDDKLLQMAAVSSGHIPFAIILLFFVNPLSLECWPYLFFGVIFHLGYQLFLVESYKRGGLSQVYPIARASSPVIVTIFTFLFLDEKITYIEILSILIIVTGLGATVGLKVQHVPKNAAIAALITGCFIASYSMVDGYGGRVGQSPVAYYCWLSIINGLIFLLYARIVSPRILPNLLSDAKGIFWVGGGASLVAYAMVMWAFSKAPIAVVMAMRETSILFAILIGFFFLKEKLTLPKIIGTFITLAGVILLRVA